MDAPGLPYVASSQLPFRTPGSRAELDREQAAELQGVRLLKGACDTRRRIAVELDLSRHLVTARAKRWAGHGWTADQLARLGTAPDAELARRFGRTRSAV